MKKIFLISATLLLFAVPGFSQLLKPVKIDSLVTVALPASYQKIDTLGQQVFSANSMLGYMMVIRASNAKNNAPLQKENDLNKVQKDYIKDLEAQSKTNALNVRDSTIGSLKTKLFTLHTDDGQGDVRYKNVALIYTQDAVYTFEYGYPDNRAGEIKGELTSFMTSIKLSPELQRNDQYISNAKGMSPVLEIGLIGGGAVLIIVTLVMYMQKRRRLEL